MNKVQKTGPAASTLTGLSPERYATTLSIYFLFLQRQADLIDGRTTFEEHGEQMTKAPEEATS